MSKNGPIERVTFSYQWNTQGATPGAAQISDQLAAYRSSQTGLDAAQIMTSVTRR